MGALSDKWASRFRILIGISLIIIGVWYSIEYWNSLDSKIKNVIEVTIILILFPSFYIISANIATDIVWPLQNLLDQQIEVDPRDSLRIRSKLTHLLGGSKYKKLS